MINKQELDISNKSYTNKDFPAVYAEILDIATKLSRKWQPDSSNESDPGILLLKLLAFVADKNNYNIDKNVLECFLPSATQRNSVQNICEMNGYNMKYYQSATVEMSVVYGGDKLDSTSTKLTFSLPAFETVFTTSDGSVKYTLVDEDIQVVGKSIVAKGLAIQGTLKTLDVGDSTVIHLVNLDDHRRIYLPDKAVAENGVYIFNTEDTISVDSKWTRKENLNAVELGKRYFKFGFDSKMGLPYIEFPVDISSLIGAGITIKYILTDGVDGNVKAKTLNQLSVGDLYIEGYTSADGEDYSINKDDISVINATSSINGADPETIDEAYNNFKKVVGTFETLVTCRDYANAIYNLYTSDNSPVVSNCQVADRRDDINFSNNVITYNRYGIGTVNNEDSSRIKPFDICLYPLKAIKTVYNSDTYNASFRPDSDSLNAISEGLEELKTLSHDYKIIEGNNIYAYKVLYSLKAKIVTNYKVNAFEQIDIKANIYDAIYRNFNSRMIDYGYEIPMSTIEDVIKNADPRIKSVSGFDYTDKVVVMDGNGEETPLAINADEYIDLLAKNIVSGKLELFNYDNQFKYDFGQKDTGAYTPIINNVQALTTNLDISIAPSSSCKLLSNQTVQFIAPQLTAVKTYPYGVNYCWTGSTVADGSEHLVTGSDVLYIEYTDTDGNDIVLKFDNNKVTQGRLNSSKSMIFSGGTTVSTQPIFSVTNFADTNGLVNSEDYATSGHTPTKILYDNNTPYNFFTLKTNQTIVHKEVVVTTLDKPATPCYWIRNTTNNALFTEQDKIEESGVIVKYQIVLGENEYFAYPNETMTQLNEFGSGTLIEYVGDLTGKYSEWQIPEQDGPSLSDIADFGLNAFKDYPWIYKSFSTTNPLSIQKMQILTLVEGDVLSNNSDNTISLNNSWGGSFGSEISYTIYGEGSKRLTQFSIGDMSWTGRTRLDLNVGPDLMQSLNAGETIRLITDTEHPESSVNVDIEYIEGKNISIMSNSLLDIVGGKNLNLGVKNYSGDIEYPIGFYVFDYEEPKYKTVTSALVSLYRNVDGYVSIPLKSLSVSSGDDDYCMELNITNFQDSDEICSFCMYYDDSSANPNVDIYAYNSDDEPVDIGEYNSGDTTSPLSLENERVCCLHLPKTSNITKLKIKYTVETGDANEVSGNLIIGKISKFPSTSPFNSKFGDLQPAQQTALKNKIKALATKNNKNIFYYDCKLDTSKEIDSNDLLSSEALFDSNNIANKFTICQIDLNNSSIDIAKESKL